jgi:pilus assembly protein CpaE
MTSTAALQPDPGPITACTVSRDIQNFDLLIEDMEAQLGEGWGDLAFEDVAHFLAQPDARALEFIAVAVDDADEDNIAEIGEIVRSAKQRGIRVIVIAEELSPIALHQLMRIGADDFVPYPLPEGALREAIERLRRPAPGPAAGATPNGAVPVSQSDRHGVLLPVHGLAGGVGASTFAVNLAWELAQASKDGNGRVCLIDLDLQFGSVATYLDLPRKDAVFELLSDISSMDRESFMQALQSCNGCDLQVLTAPSDILPLDMISSEDVKTLLGIARSQFEFVIVDMPSTLVQWTETVLSEAQLYFALFELDMRSAQNALRLIRALKSENLPHERLRYVMNRAPKFADLSGKSRVKRMAESLDIDIEIQLPDGGKIVSQASDHGLPLAETAGKSPLRKEIQKLAMSLFDLSETAAAAEA